MHCPRLEHFVRFNTNGTVSRCGHMINAPQFNTLEDMVLSTWLVEIKSQFEQNQWPQECNRCKITETVNSTSIRLNAIELDRQETQRDYLQVGGILDNVCNSACQTCDERASTKIGSLKSKNYYQVDNSDKFWQLPQNRILHLDINGGEPSASKNYKKLLENLPPNLKTLRVNTNCAIVLPILKKINDQGVKVTVTVSFDGIDQVHDYIRWPIKWDKFYNNLLEYKSYQLFDLNLWTTVSVLNINNLENIFNFVEQHNLNHSFALLEQPEELNISYTNHLTKLAKEKFNLSSNKQLKRLSEFIAVNPDNQAQFDKFIKIQDQLRGISISNFIK